MDIVAVIPARGGSKGIPRKNLALCAGRPLIDYTVAAARATPLFSQIIVSTDDTEIAEHCRALGVEVPFLRPAGLAGDATPMIEVLLHLLEWLDEQRASNGAQPVGAIALLQPTSPLRKAEHLIEAGQMFLARGPSSLVSVVALPHQYSPHSVQQMMGDGVLRPYMLTDAAPVLRRQDKPRLFARNGPALLYINRDMILKHRLYDESTLGYVMSQVDSIDIDSIEDLRLAELVLEASAC